MSKPDYSNQENITITEIPVKGSGADKFSIRVDRIRFLDDDSRNEVDIRVWSNTGRPSRKGLRMTENQACEVYAALGILLNDIEKDAEGEGALDGEASI
jgi:hypothetical protein